MLMTLERIFVGKTRSFALKMRILSPNCEKQNDYTGIHETCYIILESSTMESDL